MTWEGVASIPIIIPQVRKPSFITRRISAWLLDLAKEMSSHRPYGTPEAIVEFAFPTLKRGANKHCAYGAAEPAAEEGEVSINSGERHPSGPEGRADFGPFMARVNSCPFKTSSFSAACKILPFQSAGSAPCFGSPAMGIDAWIQGHECPCSFRVRTSPVPKSEGPGAPDR